MKRDFLNLRRNDFLSLRWIFVTSLPGSLLGGLVSFLFNYFHSQKELTDAILLGLVTAISLLIGFFIGGFILRSLDIRSRFKRFKP